MSTPAVGASANVHQPADDIVHGTGIIAKCIARLMPDQQQATCPLLRSTSHVKPDGSNAGRGTCMRGGAVNNATNIAECARADRPPHDFLRPCLQPLVDAGELFWRMAMHSCRAS